MSRLYSIWQTLMYQFIICFATHLTSVHSEVKALSSPVLHGELLVLNEAPFVTAKTLPNHTA